MPGIQWLLLGIGVFILYALSILIPLALIVFVAVILIRALAFKPKAPTKSAPPPETVDFDKDAAVNALAELVRCKTVSYMDPALEDNAEFDRLIQKLPVLYPRVFEVCELTRLPDRALLFRWKGRNEGQPAALG